MRILQAIETGGPGGAEQVLIALCRGLLARGHDVEVLLLKEGWLADQMRELGVPLHQLPLQGGLDRPFVATLASLCKKQQIDLIHSHEFSLSWYGRRAARTAALPHVATAHGKNFLARTKQRIATGLSLRDRRGEALIAVSADLAKELAARALPSLPTPAVIANGVPQPSDIAVRPREGGRLRLVAVGNLYPVKNHRLALDALAELGQRGIDAELTILGRGGEQQALESQAQQLGLGDRLRLAGYCEDVRPYLRQADIFLSTSLSEGMPLSFLEAMGHALPIVSSRVGGVPELIDDGVQGKLFPSGDATACADAITELANDEELRQRIAALALRDGQEKWSVETMLDGYEALYERLRADR